MRYLPHTPSDVAEMLEVIGASSLDDLFSPIPKHLQLDRPLDLPPPKPEAELDAHMKELANRCEMGCGKLSFLGAGLYEHYIPHAVGRLIGRSEFLTAYTPYQPEISQGTLQAIFEYQSMLASLLGLDVANASMYDGAQATAEGVLMALRHTKKSRALVAPTLHPEYRAVIDTYLHNTAEAITAGRIDEQGGIDLETLREILTTTPDVACLAIQSPNVLGCIEPVPDIRALCEQAGVLLVHAFNEPLAFGIFKPPGETGASIATGEGMTLGGTLGFGGPSLGVFATTRSLIRKMPGRLSGRTVDRDGRTGYVLTLSTREQHIRRERATSNICTNQGLCATAAAIYLSLLGKDGFTKLAKLNFSRAQYTKSRLTELGGVSLTYPHPTFNEFTVSLPCNADDLASECARDGVLIGVPLTRFFEDRADQLLVAVTEMNGRQAIDRMIATMAKYLD